MDTSLLSGWLPWLVLALGVVGLIYLLWRTERWWWFAFVPGVLVVAGVAAWLIGDIGGESLFAEPLKTSDVMWIGVGLAGVGLAIGNMFGTAWPSKVLSVLAAILVLAAAGNQVNKSYQQYPTVGDLSGPSDIDQVSGLPVVTPADGSVTPSPASPPLPPGPLTTTWKPTGPGIPADGKGKMSPIMIPDTQSGFQARPGWVYLPPAYFAENPQPLPVIVLSPVNRAARTTGSPATGSRT